MGVVQENAAAEVPAKVEAVLNQIALEQVRKLIDVIDKQAAVSIETAELLEEIKSSEAYCDIKRVLTSSASTN